MKSNLDLVNDTDGFPYGDGPITVDGQGLFTLLWRDAGGDYPIGYVLDRVVDEFAKLPASLTGNMQVDRSVRTLRMFHDLADEPSRTAAVAALTAHLRAADTFPLLRGWRDEAWPVHGRRGGELLFSMERAAVGLFGAVRYGVHLTAYVAAGDDAGLRVWVPRRAATKSTFPGMLDNTVAGGLTTGEDPFECAVREADEEASLPEAVVRGGARLVGVLTYVYVTDGPNNGEAGFVYPEVEWAYDLQLPPDVVPRPKDGEVDEFYLCDVPTIKRDLAAGKYKTNCAVVMLDFFIRHGLLTAEEEPQLAEIQRRMRRELPFPGPHWSNWSCA
ncbi:thiamin pyrophosphokinase-related protein [Cordyceps fumosorosea ARSEF 2679]|uniref:Thiamin pyrophosphokinase-related protein n=1 Tax=Cordyceps fumosorosea (strain ARSEF 2679) TaxID=1081104 RepID=A0A167NW32_CORFA|nr:thiamin pyrophosphokinase-related protein [Cordyceps fumosorosea ARSEF 2679]OAA56004.1 thiamin pyrophosphokinase-related protein [Cordyceps fumosorosea ARSEF 2679]